MTGGTGFIGSALVKKLVEQGNSVTVLDNGIRGAANRLSSVKSKIKLIQADIRDKESVEKVCKGMDSVIHLAYINGTEYFYQKPELVLEVGVKGMMNVIDACIKNNIKELILASSSEVYQQPSKIPTDETAPLIVPDPLNPRYSYGGGKIISELLTLNYGRKHFDRVLIFRPHNVYGPDMGFEHVLPQFILRMKELAQKQPKGVIEFPIQGDGTETRSFIFIDDFVDGLSKVIENGQHMNIYHIGTMEEKSIAQVANIVADHFNRKIKIKKGLLTKGSTKRRCPDISKIKKLGFSPKISFEAGIKKTADWYIKNSHKLKKIQ